MHAAKSRPKGLDLATYRAALNRAIETDHFIDYRAVYGYAQGIEDTVDAIEEVLKEGHAAEVIELTEHALAGVENVLGAIDDSDGVMSAAFSTDYRNFISPHARRRSLIRRPWRGGSSNGSFGPISTRSSTRPISTPGCSANMGSPNTGGSQRPNGCA
jgi:hypothetical protein